MHLVPLLIGVIAALLVVEAKASPSISNALVELREEHWFEAMEIAGVESEILYAIALTESGTSFRGMRKYGPWPWAMNISNQPRFYSSREAARKVLAQEVAKGNRQIAVGMWQIHLRYNSHYVEDPLDLIDPVTNLYVAAMVLRDCGTRYNTVRDLLSCYHSGDVDEAGERYAERVLKLARKWGQPFRIANRGADLRFLHTEKTTAQANEATGDHAKPESAGRNEREEETERPTITLTMLGESKARFAPRSHEEFLKRLETSDNRHRRRVIVVE